MRDWNARLEKACPLPPWPARPLRVLRHWASEEPSPEQHAVAQNERVWLHRLMARKLTPHQRSILKQRFGLAPYTREHTLQEIAERLGRHRAAVRAVERTALNRLTHALRHQIAHAEARRTRAPRGTPPQTWSDRPSWTASVLPLDVDPAQTDRMYWTLQHLRHRVLEAPAVERQEHQDALAQFIDRMCVLQEGVDAYGRCVVQRPPLSQPHL